jgi:nucleoside-diphosphate-sugar epimerase
MSGTSPVKNGVLLTGGTGLLGSHLGAALVRRGKEVFFLVRSKGTSPAAERLSRVLDWHGPGLKGKARLLEGDLRKEGLGLSDDARREASRRVGRVIHCASNTSFSEKSRRDVVDDNLLGLARLLDVCTDWNCSSFHLVSTAYAAGRAEGDCFEELVSAPGFFNVYEETKNRAERLARDRCRSEGIRLTITRPSIVYGHSGTGRTFRFNALYYPVRTVLLLKNLYEADLRNGGRKAAASGVTAGPGGTLTLPLRVDAAGVGVNLIPVDFFVNAFLAVDAEAGEGGVFHLVNGSSTSIDDIASYVEKRFGLRGIRTCRPENFERTPRNGLEILFERYLDTYGPYMRDRRVFRTDKSGPLLKRRSVACPPFDYAMFDRCMSYAVRSGWSGLARVAAVEPVQRR